MKAPSGWRSIYPFAAAEKNRGNGISVCPTCFSRFRRFIPDRRCYEDNRWREIRLSAVKIGWNHEPSTRSSLGTKRVFIFFKERGELKC